MTELTRQEPDRIPSRRLGAIAFFSLGAVVVGVAFSTAVLWGHPIALREPPHKTPDQIGIVEQSAIVDAHRAEDLKRAQKDQLTHYKWLDDRHQTAEIPIDRAMRIIAGQKK